MFIDFISRILGAEKVSVSNRLENDAEPSVIVKKDSNKTSPKPIPEKYRKDVALLQSKYGMLLKPDSALLLHFKRLYQSCRGKEEELIHTEDCNLILKRIGISR